MIELIERWANGWVHSRSAPAPERDGDSLFIRTGSDIEPFRWMVLHPTEAEVMRVRDHVDEPLAAIKFLGHPHRFGRLFGEEWETHSPGWMMTSVLVPEKPVVVPFDVQVYADDRVVTVAFVDHSAAGAIAACGRCGLADGWAVPDKIVTSAAYRRRGLGTQLMRILAAEAVERGCRNAVLGASPDGRHLYHHLGWRTVAPLFSAFYRPGVSPERRLVSAASGSR